MHAPPRLLIAPDSFKGTFAADRVAAAIGAGATAAGAAVDLCPMADGGEGTAAILLEALGGSWLEREIKDPLGRPVAARFALLDGGRVAALDVAAASGLPLVAPADRDAELASSYGTGELIAAAVAAGAEVVLVGAGGSATTDGGAGAIAAIEKRGGIGGASIEVLCDVTEPFERAAAIFAPQKGADPAAVGRLEARLARLAAELPRDPRGLPMGGCAGGLSGGLWARFDARLEPGAGRILDLLGFDDRLRGADAVVTGEGRLDSQSFSGKVVGSVVMRAAGGKRPCHAVVGSSALSESEASAAGLAGVIVAGDEAAMEAAGAELRGLWPGEPKVGVLRRSPGR
jgi:glycerate kinase